MHQNTDHRNLTLLRNALIRLDALPAGPESATAVAQENLDFLAMLAGLKPVCLLGRGSIDVVRNDAMCDLARELGYLVVDGPYWNTAPAGEEFPQWYVDHCRDEMAGFTAHYLSADDGVAAEVRRTFDAGGPSVAMESRLLGYPECCVADHYRRATAFHRTALADPALGEQAGLAAAMAVTPCPFTSFNMCDPCCEDRSGPAATISLHYAHLAQEIDPDFSLRLN